MALRVALLGAGRIGRFHAETLAAHADVHEVAVPDADEARAADLAARVGGVAATVEDAIASSDAGVIATSTDAHIHFLRGRGGPADVL